MAEFGKLIPFKKSRRHGPLTAKQVRFCELIFKEGKTHVQAYMEAIALTPETEYTTAKSAARRILRKNEIREYIRRIEHHAFKCSTLTAEQLTAGTMSIAFADRTLIFNDDGSVKLPCDWPAEFREAVDSLEVKEYYNRDGSLNRRVFKVTCGGARLQAMELLMKLRKMIGSDAIEGDKPKSGVITVIAEPDNEPPAPE